MNNRDRLDDLYTAMDTYIDIESALGRQVSGITQSVRKDGSFVMIPFSPTRFCELLRKVRDYWPISYDHKKKFVDVGAGLGFKVKIARRCFFEAYGIEYDKKYVDFAKKFLNEKLIHKDAFDVDYKNYDLIYFYQPICDGDKQVELENHILSTMRDDAILAPMNNFTFWNQGSNHSKVRCLDSAGLYVKKNSPIKKLEAIFR